MEAQGTGVHIVMSPWNSVLLSMVFSPSRQLPRKLLQSIWELQYCVDSVLQRQSGSLHSWNPAPGRGALRSSLRNILYLFSASRITLANLPSGGSKSPSG
jgi:hypothetical protein